MYAKGRCLAGLCEGWFSNSLVFVSNEKIYQTLAFHHISKHLKFRQNYSTSRRIFNSFLCVWKSDKTLALIRQKFIKSFNEWQRCVAFLCITSLIVYFIKIFSRAQNLRIIYFCYDCKYILKVYFCVGLITS